MSEANVKAQFVSHESLSELLHFVADILHPQWTVLNVVIEEKDDDGSKLWWASIYYTEMSQ